MAIFKSDLLVKRIQHRGLYDGREQNVSGTFRLKPGVTLTTADILHMVPLGENVRPVEVRLVYKRVSGSPTLTGGTVSVGVIPARATDFNRPTGQVFPALSANATVIAASMAGTLAAEVQAQVAAPPSANTKWGPFIVTATPTGNISVSGGVVDLCLEVTYLGEHEEADAVYTSFYP